jgi:hypothetical protein
MAEDSDGALVGNPAYGATEIIACQLIHLVLAFSQSTTKQPAISPKIWLAVSPTASDRSQRTTSSNPERADNIKVLRE